MQENSAPRQMSEFNRYLHNGDGQETSPVEKRKLLPSLITDHDAATDALLENLKQADLDFYPNEGEIDSEDEFPILNASQRIIQDNTDTQKKILESQKERLEKVREEMDALMASEPKKLKSSNQLPSNRGEYLDTFNPGVAGLSAIEEGMPSQLSNDQFSSQGESNELFNRLGLDQSLINALTLAQKHQSELGQSDNVGERLYNYGMKMNEIKKIRELVESNEYSQQLAQQCSFQPKINENTDELAQKKSDHRVEGEKVENALYRDFLNRQNRQQLIQESVQHTIKKQSSTSKVNLKSHKLAIKKIEKDIARVIEFIDREDTGIFNYEQLGYTMHYLGVFKFHFNDEYLVKLQQRQEKSTVGGHSQPYKNVLSSGIIKCEQRKLREEEFLDQLWKTLNPQSFDYIESDILFEFLKLVFDPYFHQLNIQTIIDELIDVINKISNEQDNQTEDRLRDFIQKTGTDSHRTQSVDKWATDRLVQEFQFLNSHSGGVCRPLKIPTNRHKKIVEDHLKDYTFKPQINKKSNVLEQKHVNKFIHQREKEIKVAQQQIQQEIIEEIKGSDNQYDSAKQQQMAGKIVSTKQLQTPTSSNPDSEEIQYRIPTANRHELLLEKQRVRDQKLAQEKEALVKQELDQCTFKPQIISQSSKEDREKVHKRLYEKKQRDEQKLAQERELLEAQELAECTFAPKLEKRPLKVIQQNEGSSNTGGDASSLATPKDESLSSKSGTQDYLLRMQKAREQKQEREKEKNEMGKAKNYKGTTTKTQPFKLSQNTKEQKPVEIFVEINIAPGKQVNFPDPPRTGHIAIRSGDNAKKLVDKFSSQHNLAPKMKKLLEQQLEQQISQLTVAGVEVPATVNTSSTKI